MYKRRKARGEKDRENERGGQGHSKQSGRDDGTRIYVAQILKQVREESLLKWLRLRERHNFNVTERFFNFEDLEKDT